MESVSLYKERVLIFRNQKRRYSRVYFSQPILLPKINGKKPENASINEAVMETFNLSEGGVGIISKIPLEKGDFLDFLLSIEGSNSFGVFALVKWVGYDDDTFLVGCEFINLSSHQTAAIREYVKKHNIGV